MQNFKNLGDAGGGGDHFLTKPPKGTSLADFMRFDWAITRADPFPRFVARRLDEKRDTKRREVIFHLFAGNSPLNQI